MAFIGYTTRPILNQSLKSMRPDKAKVVDEVWDEARIEGFLHKAPMGSEPAQFSKLLNAYRSMRAEDFARFIELFKADGGDVNATDAQGQSLLQIIDNHAHADEFKRILQQG